MNVFEDLIEALKEENLLESTVIEKADSKNRTPGSKGTNEFSESAEILSENSGSDFALVEEEESPDKASTDTPRIEKPVSAREFYRKRAMDEVSSLQMVEHILSGVEREHLKMAPMPFNDINVKQALHRFLQITDDNSTEEGKQAEFDLLQQTQSWFAALSERDENISVGNVRRFVENSRPALSSQAMIALARFHRNAPFTDLGRSKFDFVVTKLFSREVEGDQRRLLFAYSEMIGHLKTLYDNWSSIEVFTPAENSKEIGEAVARFKRYVAESESTETLDALLTSNLFDRIRVFKDEIGELFFAREVTAAAIDCNVRVGNRFVELVGKAKRSREFAAIEDRLGNELDQLVSNTTGRTFELAELLRSDAIGDFSTDEDTVAAAKPKPAAKKEKKSTASRFSLLGVNKWLLAFAVLTIAVCVGGYLWANQAAGEDGSMKVASEIDISMTDLKQHLQKARSSNETLYGVTSPSWDALSDDEKKEFLKKVTEFAGKRGLSKVNLLNYRGRTVAFSNKYRFEVLPPA